MAHVVVIDDHPAVLKLMATTCEEVGHQVYAFDNGPAALAAVHDLAPPVALVDRFLGESDGLDLVRQIREISPGTRCVMVTGCAEAREIVLAMRGGAFNYITKPFEPAALVDAVNEALTQPDQTPPVKQKLVIVFPKGAN